MKNKLPDIQNDTQEKKLIVRHTPRNDASGKKYRPFKLLVLVANFAVEMTWINAKIDKCAQR